MLHSVRIRLQVSVKNDYPSGLITRIQGGDILYNCMRVWDLSWAAKYAEYLVAYDRMSTHNAVDRGHNRTL